MQALSHLNPLFPAERNQPKPRHETVEQTKESPSTNPRRRSIGLSRLLGKSHGSEKLATKAESLHSQNENQYTHSTAHNTLEPREPRMKPQLTCQVGRAVVLDFSEREAELLRYLWNQMVLEEFKLEGEEVQEATPGAFPVPKGRNTKHISVVMTRSLFCQRMYENLLAMAPSLGGLFPLVSHQAGALAGVITLVMSHLENISVLEGYLSQVAKRHARIFAVDTAAFDLVGQALIRTFHEGFGQRFTQELDALWRKFYDFLAKTLLQMGKDPRLLLLSHQDLRKTSLHRGPPRP